MEFVRTWNQSAILLIYHRICGGQVTVRPALHFNDIRITLKFVDIGYDRAGEFCRVYSLGFSIQDFVISNVAVVFQHAVICTPARVITEDGL